MKYAFKTQMKQVYGAKAMPSYIVNSSSRYFAISGAGNPNEAEFSERVGVLYSLAYGLKILYKNSDQTTAFTDYVVPPLEAIWDLSEAGRKKKVFSKDDFVYELLLRIPEFIPDDYILESIKRTEEKKFHPLLEQARVKRFKDEKEVLALHIGSYDDEAATFQKIDVFLQHNHLKRATKRHKEIYLSDPKRISEEKRKTILVVSVLENEEI